MNIERIPEKLWRQAAASHRQKVWTLVHPGFGATAPAVFDDGTLAWKALDSNHPTYNFLIEYYGLRGLKGPRRLARWSPSLHDDNGRSMDAVLLEGGGPEDFAETLFLKGATVSPEGVLYAPRNLFPESSSPPKQADSFRWFRDVLKRTTEAEPVLHCFGLHEWAMLYQPPGAESPPSARYQQLPRRVSQEVINRAVERNGVTCTHVDAMRFFAEASRPYSQNGVFGTNLERHDQLRLEQPACVHAQMDLLKWSLKLQPFIGADIVADALESAIEARKLDVAASPYDASAFGLDAVPVETESGRIMYRKRQMKLMKDAMPTRQAILDSYNVFIDRAFETVPIA